MTQYIIIIVIDTEIMIIISGINIAKVGTAMYIWYRPNQPLPVPNQLHNDVK